MYIHVPYAIRPCLTIDVRSAFFAIFFKCEESVDWHHTRVAKPYYIKKCNDHLWANRNEIYLYQTFPLKYSISSLDNASICMAGKRVIVKINLISVAKFALFCIILLVVYNLLPERLLGLTDMIYQLTFDLGFLSIFQHLIELTLGWK